MVDISLGAPDLSKFSEVKGKSCNKLIRPGRKTNIITEDLDTYKTLLVL